MAGHICGMDTIKLTGPADLITAVPALLGLVPTRSAVLICMTGTNAERVDLLMRVDLPDPHEVGDIPNQVSELADLCVRRGAAAVSLVVVEDRAPIAGDVAHRGFVRALRRELNRSGTQLSLAVSTTAITTGSVWHDYLGAATGVLPDPSASIVGAAHVAAGRVVHADRASVATTFTPDPPWLLDQRAETMARLAATTGATKPRQYESLLSAGRRLRRPAERPGASTHPDRSRRDRGRAERPHPSRCVLRVVHRAECPRRRAAVGVPDPRPARTRPRGGRGARCVQLLPR